MLPGYLERDRATGGARIAYRMAVGIILLLGMFGATESAAQTTFTFGGYVKFDALATNFLNGTVPNTSPLRCPACHPQIRVVAVLTDPTVVAPIRRHLRIPEDPRPIKPATLPGAHSPGASVWTGYASAERESSPPIYP